MRVLVIVLAIGLAAGLWFVLGREDVRESGRPPARDPVREELERPENAQLVKGHELLTLWARTPSGVVPPGTELGYRIGGNTRWLYAEPDGHRQFTGAPIGDYEVVARATGYPEVRQPIHVNAGVPEERVLLLRKEGQPP